MFVYKIKRDDLVDGIKVTIKGKKDNIEHTFISKISYRELEKRKYQDIIESFLEALEKKIDLLTLNDIY